MSFILAEETPMDAALDSNSRLCRRKRGQIIWIQRDLLCSRKKNRKMKTKAITCHRPRKSKGKTSWYKTGKYGSPVNSSFNFIGSEVFLKNKNKQKQKAWPICWKKGGQWCLLFLFLQVEVNNFLFYYYYKWFNTISFILTLSRSKVLP